MKYIYTNIHNNMPLHCLFILLLNFIVYCRSGFEREYEKKEREREREREREKGVRETSLLFSTLIVVCFFLVC